MIQSLYINPLGENIILTVLKGSLPIQETIIPRGDDFADFPDTVMECMRSYPIDEIWVLTGPGAFTRMRIVTLTLSTLRMTQSMIVKGCHFFDIIPDTYAPILRANTTEYIIKNGTSTELRQINAIEAGEYMGYGNKNDFTDGKNFIEYKENWQVISDIFRQMPSQELLTPIYLKEPHITWSKKNTYHSCEKTST